MKFVFNDGGRALAGFQGRAGDCVVRSLAIATGEDYQNIYTELYRRQTEASGRSKLARAARKNPSPRTGVYRKFYQEFLEDRGWIWTPTMGIGTGCTVHLKKDELPGGKLVVRLSKHVCAVIDGVLHDTYDCTRNGTRCVYGYFKES